MAKKGRESKPALFSAAGLIKFSEEEVSDIHIDPKVAFLFGLITGVALLILYVVKPI